MRIVHVTLAFYPAIELGGPIQVVYENAQEMRRRGHQVSVLCTNRLSKRMRLSRTTRTEVVDGIRVTYFNTLLLPGWPGVFGPSFSWDLWRRIGDLAAEADIVHLNGVRGEVLLAAALACQRSGTPYVVQPHGDLRGSGTSFFLKRIFDALFTGRMIQHASAFLALTPSERSQCIRAGVPQEKVHRVANGVNLGKLADVPRGSFRGPRGLDVDTRILLFLGRIHETKGVDILLRSFTRMKEKAVLIIAGPDAGDMSRMRQLAGELGVGDKVDFTGPLPRESVYRALVDADIFVLTSRDDAFPMSVVEAAALGVPMLIADTCEIAHLLADHAAVVVPLDETRIAAELDLLVSDAGRRAALSRGARQAAEDHFSIEKVGDSLEELYLRLGGSGE